MKEKILLLNPNDITKISKSFEVLEFKNNFDLVYENQVPSAGVLLIKGSAELTRNSKVIQVIKAGHLLGVHQLLSETPVTYGCRIKANSEIVLLGKSEILAFMKNKRSDVYPILNSLR